MSTPAASSSFTRRALIAGGDGQLSRALAILAPSEFECVSAPRSELDITHEASIRAALEAHRPEVVFNGAAYNLVDKAEGEGMEANWRLNALGPSLLAKACREHGVPLVHFSTDYVLDGRKRSPYDESDAARPLSTYGSAKLAGENVVLAASDRNLAIRVCRLFGPVFSVNAGGKPAGNFPLLMLKLARERPSLRVVNDQIGSPSYTPDLARAVWQLVHNGASGLFQLSNEGEVAFDDYARTILEIGGVTGCVVEGISSEEYGAPARRPEYSTMSNAKAYAHGVAPMRHWREALEEFLSQQN
jgi:dTDP-4-dehydrorhamnose reductase